jgi:hypothetical protein
MNANKIPPLALAGGLIGLLACFSLIPWVSANPRLSECAIGPLAQDAY